MPPPFISDVKLNGILNELEAASVYKPENRAEALETIRLFMAVIEKTVPHVIKDIGGYAFYTDSLWTQADPKPYLADFPLQLDIDKLGLLNSEVNLPLGIVSLWNSLTNKYVPPANTCFNLRVSFNFNSPAGTGTELILIKMDVGGTTGIITESREIVKKNTTGVIVWSFPHTVLGDFITNGALFNVTAIGGTMTTWNHRLLSIKLYGGA